MEELILFLLCFSCVFIFYEIFIVNKYKRIKSGKKKNKKIKNEDPLEILYLIKKYNIDMGKISYNQILQIVAITSSLDISIVVSVMSMIEIFILKLIIGFVLIFVIIYISYYFVYLFYKKKGMIKNGK